MKVAFVYNPGRICRLDKIRSRQCASEFFYGSVQLSEWGDEVGIFEIDDQYSKPSIGQIVGDYLNKWHLLPNRTNGSIVIQIKNICHDLQNFDVVFGTTPAISFSLSVCKTLRMFDRPIIGIYCNLTDYPQGRIQRIVNGFFMKDTWAQLYSETEQKILSQNIKVNKERLIINQFGVDLDFWSPGNKKEGDYILSVGNDFRRDYDLLVRIASKMTFPFIIVTKLKIKSPIPPNVTIISGKWDSAELSDVELRNLYQQACCVVIPLKESTLPSGQSVCLQAMACGKPVILTRTKGLWSESMMRDDENVILVPVGDENLLTRKIEYLRSNPSERLRIGQNAFHAVSNEADIKCFAQRLKQTCKMALENRN